MIYRFQRFQHGNCWGKKGRTFWWTFWSAITWIFSNCLSIKSTIPNQPVAGKNQIMIHPIIAYICIYIIMHIYLLWSASPGFSISWFKAFLLGESMRIRLFTNVHNILPFTNNLFLNNYKSTGWWFQPLWKILVNGKDYPIYYGKQKMFETTNQSI